MKNSIIISGLIVGLVWQLGEAGIIGIGNWFAGAGFPVLLLWGLFRYKMLGAGDIKLFSVIGGMYGIPILIDTMILAFLAGGVLSFIRLWITGSFKYRLQYLAGFISSQCNKRRFVSYYQKERDGREPVIHFTIAILIGFCLCCFGNVSLLG